MARARERADRQRTELGRTIRGARFGVGLSIREAGALVGMSHATWWRIEHGLLRSVSVEQLCLVASAVGLDLSTKLYPGQVLVRDAGHARLLGRLRATLPRGVGWLTEVPVAPAPDQRRWDAIASLMGGRAAVEAEMVLGDIQALDGRLGLKVRDGGVDRVVLLVNDTRHNRRVLAEFREALRPRFPLDGRAVLASLRRGELPPANGLVVL